MQLLVYSMYDLLYIVSNKLPNEYQVTNSKFDVSVTISVIEYQHTFGFSVLTFNLHYQVSRVNSKLPITTLH